MAASITAIAAKQATRAAYIRGLASASPTYCSMRPDGRHRLRGIHFLNRAADGRLPVRSRLRSVRTTRLVM